MTASGHDGNGTEYSNIDDLWGSDLGSSDWYGKAMDYWSTQDASINGVLGGFGDLHPIDLSGSELFINQVSHQYRTIPTTGLGVDCGAGVGRITQFLLSKTLGRIDLVEPCAKLIEKARIELPKTMSPQQIGEYINIPLQDWNPQPNKYDLMWHQWVLLYLTDADCLSYLRRCRTALTATGVVCIKENVALKGQFLVDTDDNSVTRTLEQYKSLFNAAGLKVVCQVRQGRWPSHLFPVFMWALAPS